MADRLPSAPLPPGWTEHTAPTGHKYYYNAETKQSTYTRPAPAEVHQAAPPPTPPVWNPQPLPQTFNRPYLGHQQFQAQPSFPQQPYSPASWANAYHQRPGPRDPRQDSRHLRDRPKKRHLIPGHTPWLLITTKFRRRFVHNPETKESTWKIPQDLMSGVLELDINLLTKKKVQGTGAQASNQGNKESNVEETLAAADENVAIEKAPPQDDEDDEEEIIEEIEEEEEEEEGNDVPNDRSAVAAARTTEADEQDYEFGEEDMAAQLAELEEYGDEAEYEEEWENDTGEQKITDRETLDEFKSLLDDFNVNPFSTWDSVLSNKPQMLEDERYTFLPTMKSRKDAFSQWSTEMIQRQKDDRAKQACQDPRIPYLAMLQKLATPKLYWPEFRRKFKKEPEMKDSRLNDKDREKLYREYINRSTKVSRSTLEAELLQLFKSIPTSNSWNSTIAATDLDPPSLPSVLVADVRWACLKPEERSTILKDYLKTLPDAASVSNANDALNGTNAASLGDKAEQAHRERERQVEESRRRQQHELQRGQKRLREEEAELEKATQVGRERLRGII